MHNTLKQWFSQIAVAWSILLSVILVGPSTFLFAQDSPPFANASSPIQRASLPLSFETNEGQTNENVRYLTRGPGYVLFFTPNEIVMVLQQKQQEKAKGKIPCSVLKIKFIGANSKPIIEGIDLQPSFTNYFVGNDIKKWQRNISNYSKVGYKDLYPGIDAVFYGNPQQLEYDITIAPGANPEDVRLRFDSVKPLTVDADGHLHIVLNETQEVQMQKPLVYQMNGDEKIIIDSAFTLLSENEIGFWVGDYDHTKSLVIDPIIGYSTYLGGLSGIDDIAGITVDLNGNTYVTGFIASMTFPVDDGSTQDRASSFSNGFAYVSKLNSTGSALLYSTYLGGSASTEGNSLAIDSNGNAYVTGMTAAPDFAVTEGAFQTELLGYHNAFITKLDPTGSNLVYSTYLGGCKADAANGIVVDANGNAYIVGSTASLDFPTTKCAFQSRMSMKAISNAFVTKLSADGSSLVYSTYLGGTISDIGNAIAIDTSGNAYLTGYTNSSDFPVTDGAFQTVRPPFAMCTPFATKLDAEGFDLVYSTFVGGSFFDISYGIAVDSSGNAYITGITASPDFPTTTGSYQTVMTDWQSAFITKVNSDGTAPVYSTYLGGTNPTGTQKDAFSQTGIASIGQSACCGIAVDGTGNVTVAGVTTSPSYPTTDNAFQTTLAGPQNAILTQINGAGSSLMYSTFLGGTFYDAGIAIALDVGGNAYMAGFTSSTDFPTTPEAFQTTLQGLQNGFITKFLIGIPPVITISPDSGLASGGTAVLVAGVNFLHAKEVHFGFQSASFTVNSDNLITALSPIGHGVVNVTVSWPQAMTAVAATEATSSNLFKYLKLDSATDLKPSQNRSTVGKPVTLIAAVTPSTSTGNVEFFEGSKSLGTAAIVDGKAKLKITPTAPGKKTIKAIYNGSVNYNSSQGQAVIHVVNSGAVNILPPEKLIGTQKVNKFATQKDFTNIITWQAPSGGSNPVTYRVYRDQGLTQLAGEVSAILDLRFLDPDRQKGKAYTYYIVSVDHSGKASSAAHVTVPGK